MASLSEKRQAERSRLERLNPSEHDPHSQSVGVLLSDEITYYARHHDLISPFRTDNLKPAGYELSVGDEYFLSGEFHKFSDDVNKVVIPPFEVAILKTAEVLCLPRYLIARWNIRVKHAYKGLLWVGGPQVDPGYKGHLFCPIYNLSDKPVSLERGETLALMDFVKTTPFDPRKSSQEPDNLKRYPSPPKRVILEDYEIDELRSALFTRAGQKLSEFEDTIRGLETRFITFTQLSFAIFAGVLAFIVASKSDNEIVTLGSAIWGAIAIGLSVASFLIAIFSHVEWRLARLVPERYGQLLANRAREAQRFFRRSWLAGIAISLCLATAAGIFAYTVSSSFIQNVRKQKVVTQAELEAMNSSTIKEIQNIRRSIDSLEKKDVVTPEALAALRKDLEDRIKALQPPPAPAR